MVGSEDLIHPRDAVLHAMERVYRYRMTTTSGGNISARDDDGSLWITPAAVDKGSLTREDIVRVLPDGRAEGRHRPSSELPFHRAVYEVRPDIKAIVHAHPVALVAFSTCGRAPDTRLLPTARRVCGPVGFSPYALPGSAALGRNIAGTFAEGVHCAILENHGVVTGGADLQEAFERFETLEFCAKTVIKASQLGAVRYLSDDDAERPRPFIPARPEPRPEPATSAEKELRRQLCTFVRRAYRQRLMISTQGAFSARLDADSFLITPHRMDRSTLDVPDLVRVHRGAPEAGRTPSGAAASHAAIYAAHPEIAAIVASYPVNVTAFSVTDVPLDTRTIPESYVLLRTVQRVPFGVRFGDGRELAGRASLRRPALILENDGVLVCGAGILDAFDRLEVLESTAEAIINSRALAPLAPMSDAVVAELEAAYPEMGVGRS
jgi:L-fuculose-phosphate aldolase